MIIKFGTEFEEKVFDHQKKSGGVHYVGVFGLLTLLEQFTGCFGPTTENNFLRIEQYRQSIKVSLAEQTKVHFFVEAFAADELGTAAAVLAMRDELLLAGMQFDYNSPDLPPRILAIHQIEQKAAKRLVPGFADRFVKMISCISDSQFPITEIIINEPQHLLPYHIQLVFSKLKQKEVSITYREEDIIIKNNDLSNFRYRLMHPEEAKKGKTPLKGDGSLAIIQAKRETVSAEFIAKILQQNPTYRPLCLIPEKNRALDNAIIQEGVASLGILSASLGRPALQILKLITAFLWDPIDPYKILEFLSLPHKPLEDKLAIKLGKIMAQSPGINSDYWYANVNHYFKDLEEKSKANKQLDIQTIRQQYNIWFERKRYHIDTAIPVSEVIHVFKFVQHWASVEYDNLAGKNASLSALKDQAKKIVELLEELPDTERTLSYLKLERIVRTVYKPNMKLVKETEIGHLPFIYHNSALSSTVDHLLWWNFTDHEKDYFFSKWYPSELAFFKTKEWKVNTPDRLNKLALWQRNVPIFKTQKSILFVIPEKVTGKQVAAHSLLGDLKATFGDLSSITYDIESEKGKSYLSQFFTVNDFIKIPQKEIGKQAAFIKVNQPVLLHNMDRKETYTSLDNLFYYPYQWLFKYKLDLNKSSILSVTNNHALKGNLAHRFFELMFKEDILTWTKKDVENWIDEKSNTLLKKEGAVLLMYGREPDKIAFLNNVKSAAWTLVRIIQNNGWTIHQTEMELSADYFGKAIKGKADLVLERDGEFAIIDFKWGGKTRRLNMIKSKEDLQLVLYSKLLTQDHSWAHTAYFIISQTEMIARNHLAFKEAIVTHEDADHHIINAEIWEKMEKTYAWRMQQIQSGKIEIRTKSTLDELEEIYANDLIHLLEMKAEDATYDDYRTLVSPIK